MAAVATAAARTRESVARSVVTVLTTGGTIASTSDPVRGRTPQLGLREMVEAAAGNRFDRVRCVELFRESSFALNLEDVTAVAAEVRKQFEDPDVAGIIVTHGTDTLEETALMLHLLHRDSRPVVVTGAMRAADDPNPDGPMNLRDAMTVAADPQSHARGVLVVFAGLILGANARKVDAQAAHAFEASDGRAVGRVGDGRARFRSPRDWQPNPASDYWLNERPLPRVDIVALYPGADDTALRASVEAGARAIVLEGTGSGNVPSRVAGAVRDIAASGLTVVVSSRVPRGRIEPVYGGAGGGRDLADSGVLPSGWMRPSQARIALVALLSGRRAPDEVRAEFLALAQQH